MEIDVLPRHCREPLPLKAELMLYASAGACSAWAVQPLELIKNRMQTEAQGLRSAVPGSPRGVMQTLRHVYRCDGITGVWMGTEAAMMRQFQFNLVALGVYSMVAKERTDGGGRLSYLENLFLSVGASLCGAFASVPAELILVRYTLDRKYQYEHRRFIHDTIRGYGQIYNEEGFKALFRGGLPTVVRAGILQTTALALQPPVHDLIKYTTGLEKPLHLQIGTCLVISPLAAALSLPFDIAKTRLQNLRIVQGSTKSDIIDLPMYTGMRDVMTQIVEREGWRGLWRGILPYTLRVSCMVTMTVIFVRDLREYAQRTKEEQMDGEEYRRVMQLELDRMGRAGKDTWR